MRTNFISLLVFSALFSASSYADNKAGVSYFIPAEVTIVGLTYGVKPEIVYTPFEQAKWLEAKASVGIMPGPEYFSTPLTLGIRGRYFDFALHPMAGMAITEDFLWISDAPPVIRTAVEMDLGLSYDINDQWSIDAQAYTGWSIINDIGPTAGMRLGVRYRP